MEVGNKKGKCSEKSRRQNPKFVEILKGKIQYFVVKEFWSYSGWGTFPTKWENFDDWPTDLLNDRPAANEQRNFSRLHPLSLSGNRHLSLGLRHFFSLSFCSFCPWFPWTETPKDKREAWNLAWGNLRGWPTFREEVLQFLLYPSPTAHQCVLSFTFSSTINY